MSDPAGGTAAQKSPRHRAVRDQANPLGTTERQQLALILAPEQVVVILDGHELGQTVVLSMEIRCRELPERHVGDPDVQHLAGTNEMIEGLRHLFQVGRRIPDVGLIEVDVIRPQPSQRARMLPHL